MAMTSPQAQTLFVAANTASIAALQTTAGATALNLTAGATAGTFATLGQFTFGMKVTITSAGNESDIDFTIVGTDLSGAAASETLTGPNATTVTSTKFYKTITSITPNGAVGNNTSVGNAVSTSGSIATFAGRTRLRGLFGTTAATADTVTSFHNGLNTSETRTFAIHNPLAAKTFINPADPPEGILFKDGLTVDMPNNSFLSLTIYYDG
jgi:hypothetical protein